MFKTLDHEKVFRDPLYGNIHIDKQIILDLIGTKEFQRLRRIRQLSGVSIVFHTAEHSRFSHSLGTYHIAYRFIHESELIDTLSEYEQTLFLVCALLHDIGHGPYSHAFEKAFHINHEMMGVNIIKGSSEIHEVLAPYGKFIDDVVDVLSHKGTYPIIESLISSQLDVDRLDYLNRDASMVGANYGFVDVDRIIRILRVRDGRVCYSYKGTHAIENYLMSRYHMYWQIYYHPLARSYEVMLESIYAYIEDHQSLLGDKHKAFTDFLKDKENVNLYLKLDDYYVVGMIEELSHSENETLATMATNFLKRKLYSYLHFDSNIDEDNDITKFFYNHQDLKKYFYKEEIVKQQAYLNNERGLTVNDILILDEEDKVVKLEEASKIVSSLLESGRKMSKNIFYDKSKL